MIENLENRRLFDATFHAKTGIVDVAGTNGADTITVQETVNSDTEVFHIQVFVNSAEQLVVEAKLVKGISISGESGPDKIDAETVSIPTTIDGGKGNDTLIGGIANDKLVGGGGSNSLSGGRGNDLLVAGLQADTINGNGGNDRIIEDDVSTPDLISGGSGTDTVDYSEAKAAITLTVGAAKSSAGSDIVQSDVEIIRGSRYADKITDGTGHPLDIFGNDGNDTLIGGSGNDTLHGGAGKDLLEGMGGNDHFRAKDGQADTIDGGHGADVVETFDPLGTDTIKNV